MNQTNTKNTADHGRFCVSQNGVSVSMEVDKNTDWGKAAEIMKNILRKQNEKRI
jgi:hypothetical protein